MVQVLFLKTKMDVYKVLIAKGEQSLDDTLLEPYIKSWLYNVKKYTLKDSSFDRAESTILTHIVPRLGHYKISDLTGEFIQSELNKYMSDSEKTGKPLSCPSINKAFVYLHSYMHYAAVNRKLKYNPCYSVILPQQKS